MVAVHQVVDRAETFIRDEPKRQKANCIIGLMGVDAVSYGRVHAVAVIASAGCW